jgi:hypothetical protein
METNKKVDISPKGLEDLLNKSIESAQEDRDLALDRYRTEDETCNSTEEFAVKGKIMVDFLKLAASRSDFIFGVAKLVKDIVYKDDSSIPGNKNTSGGSNNKSDGDAEKSRLLKALKEIKDSEKAGE